MAKRGAATTTAIRLTQTRQTRQIAPANPDKGGQTKTLASRLSLYSVVWKMMEPFIAACSPTLVGSMNAWQRRYKAVLTEYAHEREQLFERIDALSREIASLRAHMVRERAQKYGSITTVLRRRNKGAVPPFPPLPSPSTMRLAGCKGLLALMFFLPTTMVAYRHSHPQDVYVHCSAVHDVRDPRACFRVDGRITIGPSSASTSRPRQKTISSKKR